MGFNSDLNMLCKAALDFGVICYVKRISTDVHRW